MAKSVPTPVVTVTRTSAEGVRDTLESIVIALILAFIFRVHRRGVCHPDRVDGPDALRPAGYNDLLDLRL